MLIIHPPEFTLQHKFPQLQVYSAGNGRQRFRVLPVGFIFLSQKGFPAKDKFEAFAEGPGRLCIRKLC